jgi:hypothetical protein
LGYLQKGKKLERQKGRKLEKSLEWGLCSGSNVAHLPSKGEDLNSSSSAAKTKQNNNNKKIAIVKIQAVLRNENQIKTGYLNI